MEEYKQWLEQQIERCLNDKDLQREHWAFCKAYEKFTALRQPPVISSFVCGHPPKQTYLIDGTWHCEQCGGKWESIANK